MKDPDLDFLLSEYRSKTPTDFQIQKWKKVVAAQVHLQPRHPWVKLGAAMAAGFIIGGLFFNSFKKDEKLNFAQNNSDNATIEYVVTKTN